MKHILLLLSFTLSCTISYSQSFDWEEKTPLFDGDLEVYHVTEDNNLIGRSGGEAIFSTDNGQTWTQLCDRRFFRDRFIENDLGLFYVDWSAVIQFDLELGTCDTIYSSIGAVGDYAFIDNGELLVFDKVLVRYNQTGVAIDSIPLPPASFYRTYSHRIHQQTGFPTYVTFEKTYQSPYIIRSVSSDYKSFGPEIELPTSVNNDYFYDQGRMYASTGYTDDGGLTWTDYNLAVAQSEIEDFSYKAGVIYMATEDALYSSQDSGATFQMVNHNIDLTGGLHLHLSSDRIFVSSRNCQNNSVTYSSDGAQTWTSINTDLGEAAYHGVAANTNEDILINHCQFYGAGGYKQLVSLPNDNFIVVGETYYCVSSNGDEDWVCEDFIFLELEANIIQKQNIVYITNFYRSLISYNNGVDFEFRDHPEADLGFQPYDCFDTNKVIYGDNEKLFLYDFSSEVNTDLNRPVEHQYFLDIATTWQGPTVYLLEYADSTKTKLSLATSQDEGRSFSSQELDLTITGNEIEIVTDHNENIFIYTTKEIFISQDNGLTWIDISPILLAVTDITDLIVSFDNYVYLSTINASGILKSICKVDVPVEIGCFTTTLVDLDGDGYFSNVDCDDNNPDVNPGQTELDCDGLDNDCDGITDPNNNVGILCPAPLTLECRDQDIEIQIGAWLDSAMAVTTPGETATVSSDFTNGILLTGECSSTYDITFTALSSCNNSISCVTSLSLIDTSPPVHNNISTDVILICDNMGNVNSIRDYIDNTIKFHFEDACTRTVMISDNYNGAPFSSCNDMKTITVTASDPCGNVTDLTYTFSLSGTFTDNDGDGYTSDADCDDNNPNINPGAVEIDCDGIDNNCDGNIDGLTLTCPDPITIECRSPNLQDLVSDWIATAIATTMVGHSISNSVNYSSLNNEYCNSQFDIEFIATSSCGSTDACTSILEFVDTTAPEHNGTATDITFICDNMGNVDDINNYIDNNISNAFFDSCSQSMDISYPIQGPFTLCSDTKIVVFTASDACGNLTNITYTFSLTDGTNSDNDGDGYTSDNDCDDNNPNINPGMTEICDGIDQNCDGQIDEGLTVARYFQDQDGDGYGDDGISVVDCGAPSGYVELFGDCDDTNPTVFPGQIEGPYNGIDDDCDPTTLDDDLDQDGYLNADDCDDTNSAINPGQAEIFCDGIDNDCDGIDNVDQEEISITCPDPLIVECGTPGNRELIEEWLASAISSDSNASLTDDYDFLDQYRTDCGSEPHIDNTVDFTATSLCNNSASCVTTIDVVDNFPPVHNGISTEREFECDNMGNVENIREFIDRNVEFHFDDACRGVTITDDYDGQGFSSCSDVINVIVTAFDQCGNEVNVTYTFSLVEEAVDNDGDGYFSDVDCDDNNPDVHPDQTEEPYNGIDDDCDESTLDDDLDQDGFLLADDCDDANAEINPTAVEIPNNGIDEDCDGMDLISSLHELANTVINIYPNPVLDVINIDVSSSLDYKASLYTLDGKLIHSTLNQTRIETESLAAGTYLLEIKDLKSGEKILERLVKG